MNNIFTFDSQVEDEINAYLDDINGTQYEDFPAKDRGKKTVRYMKGANVRKRRTKLLANKGYDPEYAQVRYGYKLSELGHTNPWKKFNTSPKRVRQLLDFDGKGSAYKKI